MNKKGTLKIQKSKIAILVLNQCSISAVFQIVRLPGDLKTALTGESLYYMLRVSCAAWNVFPINSLEVPCALRPSGQ